MNSLFPMRFDRALHDHIDEDDEESSSVGGSSDDDLDMEMEAIMMEQTKLQSVEGVDDGVQAIPEGDVVLPNAIDVKDKKVISQDDDVTSCCDETKHTKVMEAELAELGGTSTEVVGETEVKGGNPNGAGDSKSNSIRLVEVMKVGVYLEKPINIAAQGNMENDSQMSTNAAEDNYDMSNQNNIFEDSGMGMGDDGCQKANEANGCGVSEINGSRTSKGANGCGVSRINSSRTSKGANECGEGGTNGSGTGNGTDGDYGPQSNGVYGPQSSVLGPNKARNQKHKATAGPHGLSSASPKTQNKMNHGKQNSKNNEFSSSFWDDMGSDSGVESNWMRSDMRGRRKGRRRAKSCVSVYRRTGGLEGFLIQQVAKGQRKASVKSLKQILFEANPEKSVADGSINDSNIINCNKSIKQRSGKRNLEAMWSRAKELGVTACGEERVIMQKLKEMEYRDRGRRKDEEEKNSGNVEQVMPNLP
ncbi:hypothetical protein SLA2020_405390 [Shorea laevis]